MFYQNVLEDFFDKKLFAGSHPAGFGENATENLAALSNSGIQIIYSFEKNRAADITPFWQKKNQQHKLKIGSVKVTVPDFDGPSINQLTECVTSVTKDLNQGNKVFLHCRGGLGRTGTFLAAIYLTLTDCSVEQAIDKIRSTYQYYSIESDEQIESLHLYKASLDNMFFGLNNF